MIRKFNETGLCFPDEHFMADISAKIDATYKMVEEGAYFIINRPRQYGKTTMLYTLTDKLLESGQYMAFKMSFEAMSDTNFLDETVFVPAFVRRLAKSVDFYAPETTSELLALAPSIKNLEESGPSRDRRRDDCKRRRVLRLMSCCDGTEGEHSCNALILSPPQSSFSGAAPTVSLAFDPHRE